MKKLFLFLVLAGFVLLMVLLFPVGMERQAAFTFENAADSEAKRAVLDATVQIRLVSPVLDSAGIPVTSIVEGNREQQVIYADGLGTLVMIGGEHLILTHDHWTVPTAQIVRVEFYDAAGNHLAAIDGASFWDSIRHRDVATMLLDAPDTLPLSGAMITSEREVAVQDRLLVAYRPEGSTRVEVLAASVEQIGAYSGQQALYLKHENGEIAAKGSSGGGIWHGKQLVGNLRARFVQRIVLEDSMEALGPVTGMPMSIAAALPGDAYYKQN